MIPWSSFRLSGVTDSLLLTFCFPPGSLILLPASRGWLTLCCWLSSSRSWFPCILCWCSAVTDFVLWGSWLGRFGRLTRVTDSVFVPSGSIQLHSAVFGLHRQSQTSSAGGFKYGMSTLKDGMMIHDDPNSLSVSFSGGPPPISQACCISLVCFTVPRQAWTWRKTQRRASRCAESEIIKPSKLEQPVAAVFAAQSWILMVLGQHLTTCWWILRGAWPLRFLFSRLPPCVAAPACAVRREPEGAPSAQRAQDSRGDQPQTIARNRWKETGWLNAGDGRRGRERERCRFGVDCAEEHVRMLRQRYCIGSKFKKFKRWPREVCMHTIGYVWTIYTECGLRGDMVLLCPFYSMGYFFEADSCKT